MDFFAKSTENDSSCSDGHGSADPAGYGYCTLCPRACGAKRSEGRRGFCGQTSELRIARVGLHMWEEPCLSGTRGSGTIFFTGCSLGCIFCQNYEISRRADKSSASPLPGRVYTVGQLADAMLDLQKQGAHNINFVTGTHFVPHIIEGVRLARRKGLLIPTLYNCGGYESVDTIRSLEGIIDIYLPDMKFFSSSISEKYARAADYFERAKEALAEMVRQCPSQEFDGNGIMRKGVIVRHLMLPGLLFDTKHILDYLVETYGNRITISLMNQYTPMPGAPEELSAPLSQKHYDSMVNYLSILGQTNAFTQESGTVSESFIPDFE